MCIILLPLGCAIFILICKVILLHYDMLHLSDIRNIIATFKFNSLRSTICFISTLDLLVLTLAFYMPVLVIYHRLHLYYKPFTLNTNMQHRCNIWIASSWPLTASPNILHIYLYNRLIESFVYLTPDLKSYEGFSVVMVRLLLVFVYLIPDLKSYERFSVALFTFHILILTSTFDIFVPVI